jgi:hypothetical protein
MRDLLFYADLSRRLSIIAVAAFVLLGLGILDNTVNNIFAHKPWRRWQ